MKPGMHVDNLHVERTSRFEQEKNGKDNIMIETMQWVRPEEIEARSMAIIEAEMPEGNWTPGELAVVKRCIHTAADFDYASNLYFSDGAVDLAVNLMKSGRGFTIVTDTNMALAGVNKAALKQLNGTVRCFMADPDVAAEAKERGVTRAIVSMERAATLAGPVIFAIGNAPTALVSLEALMEADKLHPALIIGVPVGFVNVVEAKELFIGGKTPYIIARGRKGGSNVAASIVNALLYQLVHREGF